MTAYVKAFGQNAGRRVATEWLKIFEQHLHEACAGQVSEIFDGDAPHTPRGCVAQAWSVAELLRAALEDQRSEVRGQKSEVRSQRSEVR